MKFEYKDDDRQFISLKFDDAGEALIAGLRIVADYNLKNGIVRVDGHETLIEIFPKVEYIFPVRELRQRFNNAVVDMFTVFQGRRIWHDLLEHKFKMY